MLSVNVDLHEIENTFGRLPTSVSSAVRRTMKDQISQVMLRARKFHRYGLSTKSQRRSGRYGKATRVRTGMLEKSVLSDVNTMGTVGQAYLDSGVASYGVYVHEGHGAPGRSVTRGFPYVWEPDRFLDNSLKIQEPQIQPAFERAIELAIREAGL